MPHESARGPPRLRGEGVVAQPAVEVGAPARERVEAMSLAEWRRRYGAPAIAAPSGAPVWPRVPARGRRAAGRRAPRSAGRSSPPERWSPRRAQAEPRLRAARLRRARNRSSIRERGSRRARSAASIRDGFEARTASMQMMSCTDDCTEPCSSSSSSRWPGGDWGALRTGLWHSSAGYAKSWNQVVCRAAPDAAEPIASVNAARARALTLDWGGGSRTPRDSYLCRWRALCGSS